MAKLYYLYKEDEMLNERLAELCIEQLMNPCDPEEFNQTLITTMIPGIRRGDCVCSVSESDRYRNEHVKLYDGTTLIELHGTYDEYGHIPASFEVTDTEFAPNYWIDAIWHNAYFFPCDEIRERAAEAMTYGSLTGFSNPTHSSTFKIGAVTYTLLFDDISFGVEEDAAQAASLFREKIHKGPWEYGVGSCNMEVDLDAIDTTRCLLIA